ncbi:MAG: alkaline phosphatase family protein [Myxococcales bacterium]|nr:alkaline phosphatase family protein [Myxococcales bacterium]
MKARRVAVVGIDCLTPQLVFERYLDQLPTFRALMEGGVWGRLRSTVPPITVPAWTCMATGQDPGLLGLYGFRNRRDHSYRELSVADASWVRVPALWQLLSRRRRRSIVLGVPLTFPPRPIAGDLVCGIPVPADAEAFTHPLTLAAELDQWCGPARYQVDVREFRRKELAPLRTELDQLREARFDAAEALVPSREWELFFMVEMGVDRLHHAFWAHCHPDHPCHPPDSPHAGAISDYYRALDARLARLLELLGEDTAVLVVSDHGARTMRGAVRLNEWLIREGLLSLARRPPEASRLRPADVDWRRTIAWSDGGYYARVFLNVAGREPEGAVSPERHEEVLSDLRRRLESMPGPDGRPLGNKVFVPREVYRESRGVPPDLIVYLGGLDYRANATVFPPPGPPEGPEGLFAVENDTGADGANHAEEGVLLYRPPRGLRAAGRLDASIYDVAPTVLRLLGEPQPPEMIGRALPRLLGEA